MSKRDASEAFGDRAPAASISKKHRRRKDKPQGHKPPAAGPETTAPGWSTPLTTSEAGKVESEQLTIDSHQRSKHESRKEERGSKELGGKNKRKWGSDPRPENSHSAGQSLVVIKTEAKSKHKHGKNRSKENRKSADDPRKGSRKDKSRPPSILAWNVSIQGGYFIDQDPLLSEDEQHIILPTKSHIHIYSAATSLLVRSLLIGLVDRVTSCIMCPSDPGQILVSTHGGTVTKHNWLTGQKTQHWKTRSGLLRICRLLASKSNDDGDRILAINQSSGGERDLSHLTLHQSPDMPVKEVVLLSKHRMDPSISTLDDGRRLVAFAGDRLILGLSPDSISAEYQWREFTVPGKIVSIDARSRQASSKITNNESIVDVALGLENGAILILEDTDDRLIGKEKAAKGVDMISRRLHWHRDLVSSVKWSRDGNYLISGGRETVLVLWQLDTNQQQYLPHLSSPIRNIVVSMSGSSYVMRMADNTVMVLSTLDLVPRTNICGPSLARNLSRRLRATINPSKPDQLLLATPSDLSSSSQASSNPSATMMQTFDLGTNHQVSRQALTRNVTTIVNVGPMGRRIVDPDVVQIQVSHNGQWLATVDEWTPPETDREPLDHLVNESKSLCRTETCLRFWSWKEDSKIWEMTTRVNEPHSAARHSVLGLAVNPVRAEYTTTGSDGYIRIWTPMLRLRDGLPVKSLAGEELYTWTCRFERRPDQSFSYRPTSQAESAALSYSEDGSAIAASFVPPAGGLRMLHFIDSRTGYLRDSQLHPCPSGDVEMAFSGTHLLFLSESFLVWDVVQFARVFDPIILKKPFLQKNGRFLAVNPFDRTFALALNPTDFNTPAVLAVFDANQPTKVLHQRKVHGHVKALLPATKASGYVLVDGEARIIQLRPGDAARESLKLTSGVKDETMKGLNDIFGSPTNDVRAAARVGDARPGVVEGMGVARISDGPLRSLEDLLEQQAYSALLPVSELFEKVAALFRKAQ